jgi:hypothetical protein
MSVPPEAIFTVAVVSPGAPSGTDSGLLAPGTAPADAVPEAVSDPVGVGMGSVLRGTSSGVQPTRSIEFLNQVLLKLAKLGHDVASLNVPIIFLRSQNSGKPAR